MYSQPTISGALCSGVDALSSYKERQARSKGARYPNALRTGGGMTSALLAYDNVDWEQY
jgi:hypothetical protein